MKLLQNKDNVTAPNATYPYGTMRDRALGTPGSKVNTEFMTDYVQFFEKMFAESGLTANGLPDNFTNGFQLWEAAQISIKGYKSYSGVISQTGTSDPTLILFKNEIGSIVWTRSGSGLYSGELTGAFTFQKTEFFINGSVNGLIQTTVDYNTPTNINIVDIVTSDGNTLVDGILNNTPFEIRVYL